MKKTRSLLQLFPAAALLSLYLIGNASCTGSGGNGAGSETDSFAGAGGKRPPGPATTSTPHCPSASMRPLPTPFDCTNIDHCKAAADAHSVDPTCFVECQTLSIPGKGDIVKTRQELDDFINQPAPATCSSHYWLYDLDGNQLMDRTGQPAQTETKAISVALIKGILAYSNDVTKLIVRSYQSGGVVKLSIKAVAVHMTGAGPIDVVRYLGDVTDLNPPSAHPEATAANAK